MPDPDLSARPAATVVIVRDRADGAAELLMMERAATMAFAASALVFPGGRVDDADHELAASIDHGLAMEDAVARVAAIRETLEESGLGVGFPADFGGGRLLAMRKAMVGGTSFASEVKAHGLSLDLTTLVPFARWQPSGRSGDDPSRAFDTRFYVARAPLDQEASVDGTENVRLFWRSAATILEDCDAGDGQIIFPTRRNLERLAQFDDFDSIAAHARAIPVEKVTAWIEERDGVRHLCIPPHLGYPVTSQALDGVERG